MVEIFQLQLHKSSAVPLYQQLAEGIEGMITAAQYAREQKIPYLGICLGMQIMVMEFARDVLGYKDANSSEFTPDGKHNVIALMADQQGNIPKGGTMRLGKYPCAVLPGTKMAECYGQSEIWERHRHRYEFNNDFRDDFTDAGMRLAGLSPDGTLVEAVLEGVRPSGELILRHADGTRHAYLFREIEFVIAGKS